MEILWLVGFMIGFGIGCAENAWRRRARRATRGPRCRVCGCHMCSCTDDEYRMCYERTGAPCWWVEPNLCSACAEQGDASSFGMIDEGMNEAAVFDFDAEGLERSGGW